MKPYYQHAGITIYHGDCREIPHVLVPCDHIITDPPYSEQTHDGARGGSGDTKLIDFSSITADVLREVFSRFPPKRWAIATVDWRHILPMEQTPPKNLRFVRFGIWTKPNGAPQFTGDRPATGWEAIMMLHRDECKMKWNGGGRHAVWNLNKVHAPQHPTEKPIELFGEFVRLFTDARETILDPFMGSGTTLVAAKQSGRKAIGIEKEEKYCAIAVARLEQEYFNFSNGSNPIVASLSETSSLPLDDKICTKQPD